MRGVACADPQYQCRSLLLGVTSVADRTSAIQAIRSWPRRNETRCATSGEYRTCKRPFPPPAVTEGGDPAVGTDLRAYGQKTRTRLYHRVYDSPSPKLWLACCPPHPAYSLPREGGTGGGGEAYELEDLAGALVKRGHLMLPSFGALRTFGAPHVPGPLPVAELSRCLQARSLAFGRYPSRPHA